MLHHQESTERQYALRAMALELGWSESAIRTLDRDLGMTGTEMTRREDFKTLVADVSMGQVGAVFALEVSRLARSNLDWHRLLELCALTATLVIDEDGCYDPSDFNDGLLLGLKGTMAQAELHFWHARLQGGKLNKAKKGELCFPLPVGYSFRTPMQKCGARWQWCFASFAKRAAPMRSCIASRNAGCDSPSERTAGPGMARLSGAG